MDSLKIDMKKCLSYEHGSQKGGEETEQIHMPNSDDKIAGTISSRNENPPMFQQTYKRLRYCDLPVAAFHCGISPSKAALLGGAANRMGPQQCLTCVRFFAKLEDSLEQRGHTLTWHLLIVSGPSIYYHVGREEDQSALTNDANSTVTDQTRPDLRRIPPTVEGWLSRLAKGWRQGVAVSGQSCSGKGLFRDNGRVERKKRWMRARVSVREVVASYGL
ncbi:unnamed protein product [Dovyalis caffra]|uniref:Uncharacterized protein n=1 Tax=Dovyalis caffra TaxID=77055 RepID=A0AAV1S7S0_9ROSI|nr:unnamed protein product [Dovyalis caffra]